MDFDQTDNLTDVDRPDGERIRVRFRGDLAEHLELTAGLTQLLLDATDGNFYEAVTTYASEFGFDAAYFLGTESVIIEISERPTLKPLVNASGGSPRSSASRHPNIPVSRPLERLRRLRTPSA
jgi:hypothetical protein